MHLRNLPKFQKRICWWQTLYEMGSTHYPGKFLSASKLCWEYRTFDVVLLPWKDFKATSLSSFTTSLWDQSIWISPFPSCGSLLETCKCQDHQTEPTWSVCTLQDNIHAERVVNPSIEVVRAFVRKHTKQQRNLLKDIRLQSKSTAPWGCREYLLLQGCY